MQDPPLSVQVYEFTPLCLSVKGVRGSGLCGYHTGNFAKCIHERLQLQDPSHPAQVYEFTRLCLSVRLSGDGACVDNITLRILLYKSIHERLYLQDLPQSCSDL